MRKIRVMLLILALATTAHQSAFGQNRSSLSNARGSTADTVFRAAGQVAKQQFQKRGHETPAPPPKTPGIFQFFWYLVTPSRVAQSN